MTMPPIDLSKIGFIPRREELIEAKRVFRKIFKEWLEIDDLDVRLATPISAKLINKRAKQQIQSKRVLAIVKAMMQQMTYTKEKNDAKSLN